MSMSEVHLAITEIVEKHLNRVIEVPLDELNLAIGSKSLQAMMLDAYKKGMEHKESLMSLKRKLLTQAFNSAKSKGHIIQWNKSPLGEHNKEQYGSCINPGCSAWVILSCKPPTGFTILPIPLPGQVEGPAVALNCPAAEEDCC